MATVLCGALIPVLGRYAEAREVAQVAMGKYTQLETECTGVLAQLERKEQSSTLGAKTVRLYFMTRVNIRKMSLSGNWSNSGSYADIHGWEEVPMHRSQDGLGWEYQIQLQPSDDFPMLLW